MLSFCEVLPAYCPSINGIGNGIVDMTGRRYNDTVTVTCGEGSWYTGTSYRKCLRNGSWSGKDGVCEYEGEKVPLLLSFCFNALYTKPKSGKEYGKRTLNI